MGPKGKRPIALGHYWFKWLDLTPFGGPTTGETVWFLSNGVSKALFAGLLDAFAKEVGAGPDKRIVLLLDNAGFHTRPNLRVPNGLGPVDLPPYSPQLQPAETLWTLVDEPVVNTVVPNQDTLIDSVTEWCRTLTTRQPDISSRTNFAWWTDHHIPSSSRGRRITRWPATGDSPGSGNGASSLASVVLLDERGSASATQS